MCDKKRICVDLDADIHKKLKMIAVEQETTISEIVKNLIKENLLNDKNEK